MRLHKPVGIYLLLWPTLIALWLAAAGQVTNKLLIIFSLGVILTRSAGCVINDYADIKYDKHVLRTKNRPLTSEKISKFEAIVLFGILIIASFILVLQTNMLTILLSLGALMVMIVYPYMKRHIQAPQLILGIAFSWSVPMAFAATHNTIPIETIWLIGFVISWAIAYDTMYAMGDLKDDIKIGIKSTAILFAPHQRIWIIFFQIIMVICLVEIGLNFNLNWLFYSGIALISIIMAYQHISNPENSSSKYFDNFLSNHWLGLIILLCVIFQ